MAHLRLRESSKANDVDWKDEDYRVDVTPSSDQRKLEMWRRQGERLEVRNRVDWPLLGIIILSLGFAFTLLICSS
jgi:uncharacterized membrane protein